MKSKKQLLKSWKVYPILDSGLFPESKRLLNKFKILLASPVDAIQLRFKDFGDRSLYKAAEKMALLARAKRIPLIINDRPEIALSLGASGVHLGRSDLSLSAARKMLGTGGIIGCTIRGEEDMGSLVRKYADYVSVGPFFRTPLKPKIKAVPRDRIRKLVKGTRMPLVAIGGIDSSNVREVTACGISTVAFVRYAITGRNTRRKIELLKELMT